jgi:hypothetical protein
MVLISILSSELYYLTPIIFEFKYDIKKHIIIFDQSSHENIHFQDLQNGIKNLKLKYNLTFETHSLEFNEDCKNSIDDLINKINNITEGEVVYLNTGNSMIHISIILSIHLLNKGNKIISYDKIDNTYNLVSENSIVTKSISNYLDIEDYLLLIDKPIINYLDEDYLNKNKEYIFYLFEHFDRFSDLRLSLLNQKKINSSKYQDLIDCLIELRIVQKDKNNDYYVRNKKHLAGGILEEYIYWLLKELDFDDIKCSVQIKLEKMHDRIIQNEFDILLIKNNHIYAVECKKGSVLNGDDVIYKFDSLLSIFGNDSKAIIVNISRHEKTRFLKYNTSENFNKYDILRGLLNNIEIYHEKYIDINLFKKNVKDFFNV